MAKRKLAIFTVIQNEPEFLPKWLAHYATQVDQADIYILHHAVPTAYEGYLWELVDSSDSQYGGVTVVPIRNDLSFDHRWLAATVSQFQGFLLQSYKWVLFAEADELVAAAGVVGGLRGYVDRLDAANFSAAAVCRGYEVVHRVDEPPLRLDEPWLPQRSWWTPNRMYSKTLLAKVRLQWTPGFHGCDHLWNNEPPGDLYLVHLKKVDFDTAMVRSRRTAARDWSPADVASGAGGQNRIVDEAEMRRYFDADIDDPAKLAPLVRMPDWVKDLA